VIHVSVSYPNGPEAAFDHQYYREKHIPLVRARLGTALKRAEIDRALSGGQLGEQPLWMAAAQLFFDSLQDFQSAFGPHATEIMGDIPNFTNVQPQIVISESTPA
jgi:uncharacterized protein (TIGR02118 family)